MARCKNIGGGLGDEEFPPSHPTTIEKGKGKAKTTTKKRHTREEQEVAEALAVVVAYDRGPNGSKVDALHIDSLDIEEIVT
jgi:hypothetical protein